MPPQNMSGAKGLVGLVNSLFAVPAHEFPNHREKSGDWLTLIDESIDMLHRFRHSARVENNRNIRFNLLHFFRKCSSSSAAQHVI